MQSERRWQLGDKVKKKANSSWRGVVCGFYNTAATPNGYSVVSLYEPGSVQVWPEAALEDWDGVMLEDELRAEITRLTEALRDAEEEKKALREAVERLRSGYADAVSGYSYILTQHGRLEGVGFDRVMDHYHDWVAMPEREGLLAGSHTLAGAKP